MKIILNIFLISSVTSVQPSFAGGEGKQVPKKKNPPFLRLKDRFFKFYILVDGFDFDWKRSGLLPKREQKQLKNDFLSQFLIVK